MRQSIAGVPLYARRRTTGVQRPRTWSPHRGGRYVWAMGAWCVFVRWSKWEGFCPTSFWRTASGWPGEMIEYPDVGVRSVKKFNAPKPVGPQDAQPTPISVIFKKYPRVNAFLGDRWYDDGDPRFPGSIWLDSDMSACKAMLKEPTLKLCARFRAATWDDLFSALETFLGLESPPWEIDEYATNKGAKKKGK